MISPELRDVLACPLCLESRGCEECSREGVDHSACSRDYDVRVRCACGGPEKSRLVAADGALRCPCCGIEYPIDENGGYVDLRPRWSLRADTLYANHDFHERLLIRDTPPVLSAGVKAAWTRRLLGLRPGDTVLDLGCGAGKFALFHAEHGQRAVGVDVAPFFLPRARKRIDLVVADLRRLPFRKGVFSHAACLDVLEHLDESGVSDVLVETRRVLGPCGRLCVYTHAMESSRLASFQRGVNRLARSLGRLGLVDSQRERLRKSDHVNAIRSHEHFDALCAAAGLVVSRRRYYNVVFKAVVEDLWLRLYEQARARRRSKTKRLAVDRPVDPGGAPHGRGALLAARLLTRLLMLDVTFFGRIRTGPFFGLIEKRAPDAHAVRPAPSKRAGEPES
ncbi:MAG: methyltransferase domain-containing protein [Vicinamibacteria bacterium]|nr:methyltransferase domain-containing protein [Vicinamibacteria bacterium]